MRQTALETWGGEGGCGQRPARRGLCIQGAARVWLFPHSHAWGGLWNIRDFLSTVQVMAAVAKQGSSR